jgi:hypothetical protein
MDDQVTVAIAPRAHYTRQTLPQYVQQVERAVLNLDVADSVPDVWRTRIAFWMLNRIADPSLRDLTADDRDRLADLLHRIDAGEL